jgi:hypothetical protein
MEPSSWALVKSHPATSRNVCISYTSWYRSIWQIHILSISISRLESSHRRLEIWRNLGAGRPASSTNRIPCSCRSSVGGTTDVRSNRAYALATQRWPPQHHILHGCLGGTGSESTGEFALLIGRPYPTPPQPNLVLC